jgi:PKD domain/Invasin, domain 3
LLLLLTLLPAAGCDKVAPVAPSGTTLTISANPARIDSPNGTSTVTVVAIRPNGTPVNPGTQIRFSTDLGTVEEVAETDESGVARATLRGDGRIGMATISATTGGVAEAATLEVQIGTPAASINLQPNPTTIAETGGTVQLVAVLTDSSGRPLQGRGVIFSTEVGVLRSGGAIRQTNASGQATDRLDIAPGDLTNGQTSFTVSVQAAGGGGDGGGAVTDTFEIRVQGGRPEADFEVAQGASANEVAFINTSTGGVGTLEYRWDFGEPGRPSNTSTEENPTHTYQSAGTYTVRLDVVDEAGQSSVEIRQITVPVDDE